MILLLHYCTNMVKYKITNNMFYCNIIVLICSIFFLNIILKQTYTGTILVAVNPYKELGIYSNVSKLFSYIIPMYYVKLCGQQIFIIAIDFSFYILCDKF